MTIYEALNSNQWVYSDRFIERLRCQNLSMEDFPVEILLQRATFLQAKAALVGIGADYLPLAFDLTDERLGSLLLVNDHLPTIRHLMHTTIRSLQQGNSPLSLQYIVISDLPEKWMAKIHEYDPNYDFCAGVVGGDEISAEDWVIYLAQKVEKHLQTAQECATIILFVDDLAIIERMEYQTRKNFEWLLKYGAQVNIWVFAGLDFMKVDQSMLWLETFKTRVYGQMNAKHYQTLLKYVSEKELSKLKGRNYFIAKIGTNWIPFWAPKLQG